MEHVIGNLDVELDGRFASVRTKETNLGESSILLVSYSQHGPRPIRLCVQDCQWPFFFICCPIFLGRAIFSLYCPICPIFSVISPDQ